MKAEEVIRKLHTSWSFTEELELIQEYAKDQIEKDREDLIKENKLTTNGMIAQTIRNRPIILD